MVHPCECANVLADVLEAVKVAGARQHERVRVACRRGKVAYSPARSDPKVLAHWIQENERTGHAEMCALQILADGDHHRALAYQQT